MVCVYYSGDTLKHRKVDAGSKLVCFVLDRQGWFDKEIKLQGVELRFVVHSSSMCPFVIPTWPFASGKHRGDCVDLGGPSDCQCEQHQGQV